MRLFLTHTESFVAATSARLCALAHMHGFFVTGPVRERRDLLTDSVSDIDLVILQSMLPHSPSILSHGEHSSATFSSRSR